MVARAVPDYKPNNPMKDLYLTAGWTDSSLRKLKERKQTSTDPKYETSESHIEDDKTKFRDAVDHAYQLFFFTLVCVWDTPYKYKLHSAVDQYGKGRTVTVLSSDKKRKSKVQTQAAHTAVTPCLVARDRRNPNAKPFIFRRNATYGIQSNGTDDFIVDKNKADTLRDQTLRTNLIRVINKVAKKTITVQEGMRRFDRHFTRNVRGHAESDTANPSRKRIFEISAERAEELNMENPIGLDQMLTLRVKGSPNEEKLRRAVYIPLFKHIQKIQELEEKAAKILLAANKKVLPRSKSKCLGLLNWRLRYALLKTAKGDIRSRLNTLLCVSAEQLEAPSTQTRSKKQITELTNFQKKHRALISKTLRAVGKIFEKEQKEQLKYKSRVFYALLRGYKDWKQKDFIERFEQLYPSISMYPAKISRWGFHARLPKEGYVYKTPENQRRKPITDEAAERICNTFDIDRGVLIRALC